MDPISLQNAWAHDTHPHTHRASPACVPAHTCILTQEFHALHHSPIDVVVAGHLLPHARLSQMFGVLSKLPGLYLWLVRVPGGRTWVPVYLGVAHWKTNRSVNRQAR